MFSLEELSIISASGVNHVFTPSNPVEENALFCGRNEEVGRIQSSFTLLRKHCILFGDRGVGKTSLALHSCKELVAANIYDRLIHISCSSNTTFEAISLNILEQLGFTLPENKSRTKNVGITGKVFGAGSEISEDIHVSYAPDDPQWLARKINDLKSIFLIDEYDMLCDSVEKAKVSELIKSLSDHNSSCRIIIVGIAISVDELLAGHESIVRCIEQIKLDRMTDDELRSIINAGELRLNLSFDEDVRKEIIHVSQGYPYYTHLLSLHAAIESICVGLPNVSMEQYNTGLEKAKKSVEQSLRDSYDNVVGVHRNYKKTALMYAAAQIDGKIDSASLRDKYEDLFGKKIEQLDVNNNFVHYAKEYNVIRQLRKGIYIFTDPRMPSYINLLGKPQE